jgi:glyoxylate utilization-related uncharacterized protein
MHYFYDTFEEYTWQYIADTHSDSVKTEVIADLSLAKEFRVHITRFQPGAGAEPHFHEWSHAMYIMNGTGRAVIEGEEAVVTKGMLAFAPPHADGKNALSLDELREKYKPLARSIFSEKRVKEIEERIMNLEEMRDFTPVVELLSKKGG